MKRTFKAQHGMSLVEATIILLVLMLLTSVLAPSIYDFVVDAKMVKVKEDCEAIGVSLMRLVRDVGPCLQYVSGDCSGDNRIDALYSRGVAGGFDWPATGGDMEEQFTTNTHSAHEVYPLPVWRGAYLSAPIGPDPWGTRYGVNVKFLGEQLVANQTSDIHPLMFVVVVPPPPDANTDVFCLSAGPNKRYETSFAGNDSGGTLPRGDDFTYVIAGSQYSRQ
jgi:type II secretory pathway pseudopilin PulG